MVFSLPHVSTNADSVDEKSESEANTISNAPHDFSSIDLTDTESFLIDNPRFPEDPTLFRDSFQHTEKNGPNANSLEGSATFTNSDSDSSAGGHEDFSAFLDYVSDENGGSPSYIQDLFDPILQSLLCLDNLDSDDDDDDTTFDPQVRHPDYLVSASCGAGVETPVTSNSAREALHIQLQATPRLNTAAGCGTRPKEADYDDKILLEMDRKHAEIDLSAFMRAFLPGTNLTRTQLRKIGDFTDLDSALQLSPQVAEPVMYPILVGSDYPAL
jgi:hypothetical protein